MQARQQQQLNELSAKVGRISINTVSRYSLASMLVVHVPKSF